MTKYAFIDSGDGYYEVDVPEGFPLPEWTTSLTPTAIRVPAAYLPNKQEREDAILATQGKGKDRLLIQQVIAFVESQAPALATQYGVTVSQALAMLYERNKSYRECKDTEAACRLNDATT